MVFDDFEVVISKMVVDEMYIVLLIIIEGGYNYDLFSGEFDFINFDI